MNTRLEGKPAFAYLTVELNPGESIITESDAMSSMDADLDLNVQFNGGIISALLKKFLGKESLFINRFTNNTASIKKIVLTQANPGDIMCKELQTGQPYYLQPGAYIASEKGVNISLSWAGFASWIGGEGLFRLKASGNGKLFYGAYGSLIEKQLQGDYLVDTGHLVAYDPSIKISIQLAGGIISSLTSGEGIVMRLSGTGKFILQTRNISSMTRWINRYL